MSGHAGPYASEPQPGLEVATHPGMEVDPRARESEGLHFVAYHPQQEAKPIAADTPGAPYHDGAHYDNAHFNGA